MEFKGFNEDSFRFLMELGFNNNKPFYEANRSRYVENVQKPLKQLCALLSPRVLEIDPAMHCNPNTVVSRIVRDTRRTKGVAVYRDHAWLSFRHPKTIISEAFSLYFEIELSGYGYGMGNWGANPALIASMRERILANPSTFLALTKELEGKGFQLIGDSYKRNHFPNAPEAVQPYLNRKGFTWSYFNEDLRRTMEGEALFEEVEQAFQDMAPLYRFLVGNRAE